MLPGSPDHFGIPVGMFRSQQGSQKKTVQPLSHWHFLLVENNRGAYHQTWVLGVATLSVLAEFFALVGIDLVLQVAGDHRYVLLHSVCYKLASTIAMPNEMRCDVLGRTVSLQVSPR